MKLLDRYLIRQIILFTALVMAVLVCLAALFVFIEQQDDIGTGSFGMLEALFVTLLQLPAQAFQLLPVGALIGALVGLGNLARGSELIIVRASGVSIVRVALAAGGAGLLLFAGGALIGEVLAPPLQAYADQVKTFAKFDKFSFAGTAGIWVKDGDRIVSIAQEASDSSFGGVYVYVVSDGADGRQRLAAVAHADSAAQVNGQKWRLKELRGLAAGR